MFSPSSTPSSTGLGGATVRKEGRKEEKKEGRKERRKEGRK